MSNVLRTLGSGSFGTALLVQNPKRDKPTVLKVLCANDRNLVLQFKAEVQIATQLGEEIDNKTTGGVLVVYEEGAQEGPLRIPSPLSGNPQLPGKWDAAIATSALNCKKRKTFSMDRGKKQMFAWFETEYADGGLLLDYIQLSTIDCMNDAVVELAFQLVWTLAVGQARHGLRHMDLKASNIACILREEWENREETYTWISSSHETSSWAITGTPFVRVVLLDYGLSVIGSTTEKGARRARPTGIYTNRITGTPHTSDLYALIGCKLSNVDNENAPVRRGFEADMWALGILVFQMGLINAVSPSRWTCGGWPSGDQWTSDMHPIEFLASEPLLGDRRHKFTHLYKKIEKETGTARHRIGASIGILSLLWALDIDPWSLVSKDVTPIAFTLHKYVDKIKACMSVPWFRPQDPNGLYRINIAIVLVRYVRDALGDVGIDFIKKCLLSSTTGFVASDALRHEFFSRLLLVPPQARNFTPQNPATWVYDETLYPPVQLEFKDVAPAETTAACKNTTPSLCFVCGSKAQHACSTCKVYAFCSKEHAVRCIHPNCAKKTHNF